MKSCYRETEKYITLYLPTGKTGNYHYNKNSGHECKKIIINKEENEVSTSMTFIRNEELQQFLKRTTSEELSGEAYALYAKALLNLGGI